MVQGQIFLKGGGGEGGVFIFRNYFNLCKIVCKGHSKLSKHEPENIP